MYNHQLDTFIRTAELGSFGKASEALYISSTAVIQQINLLEKLCGFRLFVRTNHGVKLTPAGQSLYEDAKTLIRFSEDALQKARLLAESSESTLRIGTSLLYKCRMLPDLWTKANEIQPDLKIEIRPMKEYENRTTVFSRLGLDFDLFEGIYASAWKGSAGSWSCSDSLCAAQCPGVTGLQKLPCSPYRISGMRYWSCLFRARLMKSMRFGHRCCGNCRLRISSIPTTTEWIPSPCAK